MDDPIAFDDVVRVSDDDPIEDYIVEKSYTVYSTAFPERAWKHSDDLIENVQIELHSRLGWQGDFGIEFIRLATGEVTPRLRCFEDAWQALAYLTPILDRLAKDREQPGRQRRREITVAELVAALEENGFRPSASNGSFDREAFSREAGHDGTMPPTGRRQRTVCSACSGNGFIDTEEKAPPAGLTPKKPASPVKTVRR